MVATAEKYRFADIRTCLVCGEAVDPNYLPHMCSACLAADSWGGRFTWQRTADQANEMYGRVAARLGTSVAHVQNTYGDITTVDYTNEVVELLRWIVRYRQSGTEHAGKCYQPDTSEDEFRMRVELATATCPLCRLHWQRGIVAVNEDHRHGLEPGATTTALEKQARADKLARRAEQLNSTSLDEIVDNALGVPQ